MKNELNIEIAKFKAEIEDKILDVNEEFLKNKDEEAIKMLDILAKKAKRKENDIFDKSIMNQKQYVYNPLVGIALLFELLNYFKLLAEHQTKIDDIEKDLNKIRDIRDNFEILEEIKDNLIKFQSVQQMKDFILNSDKKLTEQREFILNLTKNLKKSEHIDEKSNSLDNAIKTLINFQNISEITKENISLVKDYINEKFGVELSEQNLIDIKQVAEYIKSAAYKKNFEARFENIDFKDTNFNNMIKEVFKSEEELKKAELLYYLKEAEHIEENSSNIDKAIKTLINFQNISEMRRDNVFFIKDYINEKFNVDFNIQNLFDIKQVAEHIKSAAERENFEAKFEDINFKNTDFNKMIQEVFNEKEAEQIKEEEVELER